MQTCSCHALLSEEANVRSISKQNRTRPVNSLSRLGHFEEPVRDRVSRAEC